MSNAAPALGGADKCRIHQLQDSTLGKGAGNDRDAQPLLAEETLEQVGA